MLRKHISPGRGELAAAVLLGARELVDPQQTEDFLKKQAGGSPEKLITVSTALGFWSEGSGEKDKAIKYYNEALGTFLDTWREYDFAKERLKRLKTPSE